MRTFLGLLLLCVCLTSPAWGYTPDSTQRVHTFNLASRLLGENMPVRVFLPSSYARDTARYYPTVYLLHGFGDNCRSFDFIGPARDMAELHNCILVAPTGHNHWYVDAVTDSKGAYESHVIREVIPTIDRYFRTRRNAAGRAVTGFSMGGQGALYLAARHPDLFGACGSISGCVDLQHSLPVRLSFAAALGQTLIDFTQYSALDIVPVAKKVKDQFIILSVGKQDPFLGSNRNLHKILRSKGIGHVYFEVSGDHTYPSFKTQLTTQMPYFVKFFSGGRSKALEKKKDYPTYKPRS